MGITLSFFAMKLKHGLKEMQKQPFPLVLTWASPLFDRRQASVAQARLPAESALLLSLPLQHDFTGDLRAALQMKTLRLTDLDAGMDRFDVGQPDFHLV